MLHDVTAVCFTRMSVHDHLWPVSLSGSRAAVCVIVCSFCLLCVYFWLTNELRCSACSANVPESGSIFVFFSCSLLQQYKYPAGYMRNGNQADTQEQACFYRTTAYPQSLIHRSLRGFETRSALGGAATSGCTCETPLRTKTLLVTINSVTALARSAATIMIRAALRAHYEYHIQVMSYRI